MSTSNPALPRRRSQRRVPIVRPLGPPAHSRPQPNLPPEALWDNAAFPWLVSTAVHISIMLLFGFAWYATATLTQRPPAQIIIPNSFSDPSLSDHPGGQPGSADLTSTAMQDLRNVLKNDGWAQGDSINPASVLGGAAISQQGLFPGSGGTVNPLQGDSSAVAAYGTPTAGGASGPRTSFYGTGGNATRIVYLIDHTGSLVDCFGRAGEIPPGTVKGEVQNSISKLVPLQHFAVVVFTGVDDGGARVLALPQLVRATPENKKLVLDHLRDDVVAQGGDTEEEQIFIQAFRTAFNLKPQLIFFMTDGNMSESVLKEVQKLNPDRSIKVNTIMFTTFRADLPPAERERRDRLANLARENGGVMNIILEN